MKIRLLLMMFVLILLVGNVSALVTRVDVEVTSVTIPTWGSIMYSNPNYEFCIRTGGVYFDIMNSENQVAGIRMTDDGGSDDNHLNEGDSQTVAFVRESGDYSIRVRLDRDGTGYSKADINCNYVSGTENDFLIYDSACSGTPDCNGEDDELTFDGNCQTDSPDDSLCFDLGEV